LWGAIRPLAAVLLVIGLFQWWQLGAPTAARIVLNILVCVVAASLLTATTPVQKLLDGVVKAATPFKRLGADPERFALTIGIMLRSIPYIAGTFADVRDSARARGTGAQSAGPDPARIHHLRGLRPANRRGVGRPRSGRRGRLNPGKKRL
jgi:energy-coupling factor transporter transmembrane protein EcfT